MTESRADSAVPPDGQAPRRRWLKIALMVCGGGLLLLVLAVVTLLLVFTDARVRRIIERQASERLEREVTIGSLEVDFRSGIRATDVRIGERAGFDSNGFARADMLDLRVRVWPALVSLGGRIHARVEIERPEITVVRNVDGELNIGDLIEMLAEERDPLDALSLDLRITGGTLNLVDRAGPEPRRTVLSELNASAVLPSYDDPLTYEVSGRAEEGSFRLAGSPKLFHEREVQPDQIDGDVLQATVSDLPIPLANVPPELKTVGGTLTVTAENGSIAAVGQFRAATAWPDIAPAAGLDVTVDLVRQHVTAAATLAAEPFGSGELVVDIADGGRERMNAGLEFRSNLARLTGSRAALDLGLPTIDGEPATSQGDISGRLALSGSLSQVIATLKLDVTGFQPHPALTGDRALPPEDVAVDGELVLGLTADRMPDSLRIVRLAAQSSFLEADVTDGRLAGLSDLRNLEADVAGQLAFSGTEFNSRFGRALGLPDLPGLVGRLNGKARLEPGSFDAGGLTVTLLNAETRQGGALTFDKLRILPVGENVPLFDSLDALRLVLEVSAGEIDAGALAAAIPERPDEPDEEPEPLDLAFLKNHAAEGTVRIDRIIYDKHRIEDIDVSLALSENQLTTPAPARAKIYGGSVEAELAADLDEPGIAHRGSVQLVGIDMNTAVSAAANLGDALAGKINGQFTWSGTGFSMIDVASTWSGDGNIAIEEGVVLDLGGHPLLARLFGPVATHLGARAFPDDRYEYGALELPLRLREGRFGTENVLITGANDLNFKVERAAVSLAGDLDARLAVEAPVTLALGLIRSQVTTNEAALRVIETRMRRDRPSIINFRVGGTAAAPRVTPELAVIDWATAIVRETLADPRSLLDGLLRPRAPDNAEEDPAEPEADQPEPGQDERDEEPERDPLRDLIEGLFN